MQWTLLNPDFLFYTLPEKSQYLVISCFSQSKTMEQEMFQILSDIIAEFTDAHVEMHLWGSIRAQLNLQGETVSLQSSQHIPTDSDALQQSSVSGKYFISLYNASLPHSHMRRPPHFTGVESVTKKLVCQWSHKIFWIYDYLGFY